MSNVSIYKAGDLQADVRAVVEYLLGRPIGADEELSIVATPPQRPAPSADRTAIARELQSLLNQREGKVQNVSEHEIDLAIDEAVEHVRHNRE